MKSERERQLHVAVLIITMILSKVRKILLLLIIIFQDSPTGKGTLVEGVSVERWNYMLL